MIIETIIIGPLEVNCYIVGDETTKQVVVIDPGDEGERIYRFIEQNGYSVQYIMLTHGHFDHIQGVNYLREKTGAQVCVHKNDLPLLENGRMNLSSLFSKEYTAKADIIVEDGQVINLGNKSISVIHTPGHTQGGVCYLYENVLISGDTLFCRDIGRTDLPGGNHTQLIESINDKLAVLDEGIEVYPGHGPSTTIHQEKALNPYIRGAK